MSACSKSLAAAVEAVVGMSRAASPCTCAVVMLAGRRGAAPDLQAVLVALLGRAHDLRVPAHLLQGLRRAAPRGGAGDPSHCTWGPAWGSLEPPRRDGENAQKTRKNAEEMGEIRPKKCEPRELTKDQLAAAGGWAAAASALHHRPLGPARSGKKIWTEILETLAKLRCILTECLTDSFGVFGSPQTSACAQASRSPRWRSPSRHKWTSSSRSEFSNEFSD